MLRGLSIYNMLLIDRLELDFQAGLNVLTGETGAGKSILLDSLGFVLGWRGRADLVRQGQTQGEVNASFELAKDHPAHRVLEEAGLPIGDELVLRRTNNSDGRKTSYVNDRRCSGEVLRKLSDVLIELHGQHDDRGLLNPRGHRAVLDAAGQLDTSGIRAAWQAKSKLEKELANAREALEDAERDRDYLAHSVEELSKLSLEQGEEAALDTKRRLMQAAGKIRDDIAKAAQALSAQGAEGLMLDASRWIETALDQAEGRLDGATASLGRALSELGEAQSEVTKCFDALDFDPSELERVEERLFEIRGLARKHNVLPDALPELATDLAQKLKAIELGGDHLATLEADLAKATLIYDNTAEAISLARHKAAHELEEAMTGELAPLKLENAEFVADVQVGEAGPDGIDEVTFLVSTNPGAPAGPINKIASGGELSRFLLALKVCLTKRSDGLTLIFDEIDRGVGGATADAVGARLAEISQSAQVLVVTHSPQVAAKGAHHWRVSKFVEDEQTFSTVEKLTEDQRIDEVARMLAGDTITEEARGAARALL